MDTFPGIEVGAEVELNDGVSAGEDPIRLENKHDLPLWQHLHYVDDSSSDESLDHCHADPSPEKVRTQEMKNTASQVQVENHLVKSVSESSSGGDPLFSLMCVNEVPRDEFVVWSNKDLQGLQPVPCYEESGISCVEVIPTVDFGHLPPITKIISPYDLPGETLGNIYPKLQSTGSRKPWGKSFQCERCGRQFGRQYNLENHRCIKKCLDSQHHIVTIENINRLERMCAEAQRELQDLQGQYRKDHVGAQAGTPEGTSATDTSVWSQDVFSDSDRCNRCGLHLNVDHVCKNISQNTTSPENTFTIDVAHSNVANQQTSQSESLTSGLNLAGGQIAHLMLNHVPKSKCLTEATKFYKCLECGKMFQKRCSITNHLRWHAKERSLMSSFGKATVESSPEVRAPNGTYQQVVCTMDSVRPSRPAQTFTCERCGKIFNQHGSYAAHILWHLKNTRLLESQEVNDDNVAYTLVNEQENQSECSSSIQIFTCLSCGVVFNKVCDFISHTCGIIEEQKPIEDEVILVADGEEERDTKDMVVQVNVASDVDSREEEPSSCLDGGDFQGYCNLVRQLSLEEQQKDNIMLPTMEPMQNQNPPEVLESIFEPKVGVEESIISKGVHIQTEESSGKVKGKQNFVQTQPKWVGKGSLMPSAFVKELLTRPNPPHRCHDCGLGFHHIWRLKRHRFKASRKKKHQCECGRTPVGSLHFLLHQLQHLRDTPFICSICRKQLQGYRQLQAHSWVHRLGCEFQCKCGARFTRLPRYLWHTLINNAKARPKTQLRPQSALHAP